MSFRRKGKGAHNRLKRTCINGHPLSGDNVRVEATGERLGGLRRRCMTCQRMLDRLYQERRRREEREAA